MDIYYDARYENAALFKLGDFNFHTPWYTVYRNGDAEHVSVIPSYNYESWSFPWPRLPNALPESYDENLGFHASGIIKCEIHKGVAYITFVYYGIVDVYVYDLDEKSGHWMSGAEDLAAFYGTMLEELRKSDEEIHWNTRAFFRSFDVVTIAQAHGYALIRRSLSAQGLKGQYIMRNLSTGEETFICGSYTRSGTIISYMDESFEWLSDDHLRVEVVEDSRDTGWSVVYDVNFDGQQWLVSESDEQLRHDPQS